MEVWAIDTRLEGSLAGPLDRAMSRAIGREFVELRSTQSMVDDILKKVAGKKIHTLHIVDHGNIQGIELGSDFITRSSLKYYRGILRRLAPHFAHEGSVYLHHCRAGQNERLLMDLAWIFEVPIFAGTGFTLSGTLWNTGIEKQCKSYKCVSPKAPQPAPGTETDYRLAP